VGILDDKALLPIEIIPEGDFFDYRHKYQPGITREICPADLCGDKTEEMQRLALRVHKILQLGSYSRIDFILDEAGDIYCLEANTLPGMTPNSLLPKEAAAAGISYVALCDKIAKMAIGEK
jgi:D-alanine-D-alanine ligase